MVYMNFMFQVGFTRTKIRPRMEENILEDILNPWNASSIFDFCYFCCPECDDKSKNKQDFVNHALAYHSEVSLNFNDCISKLQTSSFYF